MLGLLMRLVLLYLHLSVSIPVGGKSPLDAAGVEGQERGLRGAVALRADGEHDGVPGKSGTGCTAAGPAEHLFTCVYRIVNLNLFPLNTFGSNKL